MIKLKIAYPLEQDVSYYIDVVTDRMEPFTRITVRLPQLRKDLRNSKYNRENLLNSYKKKPYM